MSIYILYACYACFCFLHLIYKETHAWSANSLHSTPYSVLRTTWPEAKEPHEG